MSSLKVDWVIKNKIAIGVAPTKEKDIVTLKNYGIKSILSLCDISEANPPENIQQIFNCKRIVLPDHKSDRNIKIEEISNAIKLISDLEEEIPIYIHCLAGKERSPLICMAWLRIRKNINNIQALQYMMQVHPGTCPLNEHLVVLDKYIQSL